MQNFKIYHLLAIIILIVLSIFFLQWLYYNFFPQPYPNREIYSIALIYFIEISVTAYVLSTKNFTKIHKSLGFNKTSLNFLFIALVFSLILWLSDYFYQTKILLIDLRDEANQLNNKIIDGELIISFFSMVIFAPIVEEILFRGIILKTLCNYSSKIFAGFIVSLLFALVHLSLLSAVPLFLASSFYVYLTLRTNSIIPAISAHILNNCLTFYTYYYLLGYF